MRVNTAVCGIYHYRKYVGHYCRSGQLQTFFCSHRRSTTARSLGITQGEVCNLWMKEYGMALAIRLPSRLRMPDRIGPFFHRLWERQVLAHWRTCDLLHMHLLGTGAPVPERARSEGAVTLGEPVMCHPPRPRPRLLPHTRLFASVRSTPEPSYRLVQEIQAGQTASARSLRRWWAADCR